MPPDNQCFTRAAPVPGILFTKLYTLMGVEFAPALALAFALGAGSMLMKMNSQLKSSRELP